MKLFWQAVLLSDCMGHEKKWRNIIWMSQKLCPFYQDLLENMDDMSSVSMRKQTKSGLVMFDWPDNLNAYFGVDTSLPSNFFIHGNVEVGKGR